MISKLLKLTKGHHFNLFLSFLCSLTAELGQIFILYLLLESIINFDFGILRVLLIILILCISSICRYLEQYLGHLVAFRLLSELRNKVYKKLLELAPAKLDTSKSGEILKFINSDIEIIEVFFAHTIVPVFMAITYAIIMTIFFYYNIGIYSLYGLIGYIFIGFVYPFVKQKILKKTNKKSVKQKGRTNQDIIEILRGKEELKQFRVFNRYLEKAQKGLNKSFDYSRENQFIMTEKTNYLYIIILVFTIFILLSGVLNFIYNPYLIMFPVLYLMSFDPFISLSRLSVSLNVCFESSKNLLSFLEEDPKVNNLGNSDLEEIKNIEAKDIRFRYPDTEKLVLKDTSLEICKGQVVGIKGTSGIGKSSFVKLLMRWYEFEYGKISFNEKDIKEINTRKLRKKINYLSQIPQVFDGTLRENLNLRKDISDEEILKVLDRVKISEKMKKLKFGLDSHISSKDCPFSSGELQRIELARALLHPCELLILDEPTSNLDSINEKLILDIINEYFENTVIIISHRDSSFIHCDKVYNLVDGKFEQIK